MGGLGSGWQGEKRATVEDSLELAASELVRRGRSSPASGAWALGAGPITAIPPPP